MKINKQKFLAELGKLLTFMYEEDRQTALAMYNKMFDDAEDEQALLQLLVSPTRQAVIVARAYDAKERKLQVTAQSRAEEDADREAAPDFMLAIMKVYEECVPEREDVSGALENQVSMFDEDGNVQEIYYENSFPVVDLSALRGDALGYVSEEAAFEAAPEPEAPVIEEAEAPAEEAEEEVEEADAAPVVEEEEGEAPAMEEAETEEPQPEEDAVDAFIASFAIQEEAPAEDAAPAPAAEERLAPAEDAEPFRLDEPDTFPETVRKPRGFLLFLYILVAIPITVLGVAILLIPTILFLILAVSVIGAGATALVGAFSGFAVFADILVVLGAAIITLALGLLCLWIFIWFIGGAIGGLIRGVCALGRKWCYREVPA